MCDTDGVGSDAEVRSAMPRPAVGTALDPVALEPVDEVVITMLVDNSFDPLMSDVGPVRRVKPVELATAVASQFVDGITAPGLVAEHGLSALVRVRRGCR
jgi:7,8-dihydropterin-6-yl-methyl-4-(beta-D-ribofuranosyl)aminobenzene 5'-phosphate synthase